MPVLNPRPSGQSLVNLNSYNLLYRSDRTEERRKHCRGERGEDKKQPSERNSKTHLQIWEVWWIPKSRKGKGRWEREIFSYCNISVSSSLWFFPLLSDVIPLFTALPKMNLTNTGFPQTQLRLIFLWVPLEENNENRSASCLKWKFQLYISLIIRPKFFTFLHFWWKASYIWCR